MVHQTNQLLELAPKNNSLLYFVFFSTLTSYNIHWYFTPFSDAEKIRSQWTRQFRFVHIIMAIGGAAGAAWFFLSLRNQWSWILIGMLLTFLYTAPKLPFEPFSKLKKIAIGKTIYLASVWTYVTTVLPILVSDNSFNTLDLFFCGGRFFLIYCICILFDYRDREQDKKEGIRSFITYFNEKGIDRLFVISFLLFVLFTSLLIFYKIIIPYIIMLLIPGLIVALLYQQAKKNHSDYLYYIVLDGLMMFSSLLTLFMSI